MMTDAQHDAIRALVTASRLPGVNTPKQLRQRLRAEGFTDAEILEAVHLVIGDRTEAAARAIAESPRLCGRATMRAALAARAP